MRTVLYTMDMEPITIIDLPEYAERYLRWQGKVVMPVIEPLIWTLEPGLDAPTLRTVTINAEILRLWHGPRETEHLLLITADEESALLLKAAFLPGQQSELNERERAAFAAGFCAALRKLGSV